MNKIKEIQAEEGSGQVATATGKNAHGTAKRILEAVNVFNLFDRDRVVKLMPYLFFLFLLALIYISNSYYAEKTVREIDQINRDIKELHSEFITNKSELMRKSKLTEVADAIRDRGVKESTVAPAKIIIKKTKED